MISAHSAADEPNRRFFLIQCISIATILCEVRRVNRSLRLRYSGPLNEVICEALHSHLRYCV